MDKIKNLKTNRNNKLKTAIKNGLLEDPSKFILPTGYLLVKRKDDRIVLVPKSKSHKYFKDEDDKFLKKYNKQYTYNPKTNKIVDKTTKNVKKIYNYHKDKLFNKVKKFVDTPKPDDLKIALDKVKLNDILKTIKSLVQFKTGSYLLFAGDKIITLNQNNINKLSGLITQIESDNLIEDSWGEFADVIIDNGDMDYITLSLKQKKSKESGAFFNMLNNTKIDLTRYSIYNEFDEKNYEENCIITTFKNSNMDNTKLSCIKQMIRSHHIPLCKLKEFAEKFNLYLVIKTERRQEQKKQVLYYGNKESNEVYNIGLVNNHYFIDEKVDITKYAMENYDELNYKFDDISDFKDIIAIRENGNYKRDKREIYKTTSFQLISYMVYNNNNFKYFKNFDKNVDFQKTIYSSLFKEIDTLEYDEGLCLRKNEFKKPRLQNIYDNAFFDFETYTDTITKKHIPYLCDLYVKDKNEVWEHKTFYGEECGRYMLNSLERDTRLIAHNSTYDYTFINKYLCRDDIIMKGRKLINGNFIYYNKKNKYINIIVKDSAALIPKKLSKFGEMFKLEQDKEVMPYKLYNEKTINEIFVKLDEVKKYLNDDEYKQFVKNCEKWDIIKGDKFNILLYSAEYCKIDNEVLKNGYDKFKEWIKQITTLDIDDYLTLPSLVNAYFLKKGCYDDVYKVGGNVRAFLQQAVIGGRTMLRNNEKQYVNGLVADYDGVSLYPSSMKRIEGFAKGKPIVIKEKNYEEIKDYDMFVVEIIITKVGINRDFPLMSYITEEGIRNWSNDMVGRKIVIDKITLEDLINFQDIEFTIVRGYYWNQGFNKKVNKVINHLFNERKKMKEQGNPIQEVYKLLMNSAYGKTILKPIDTEIKIRKGWDDALNYVLNNYNKVIETYKIPNTDKYVIKEMKPINEHFNNAICGINILSMSKRIMNEVMCLAEDLKMNMYYTDTDSIHIDYNSVEPLTEAFKQKYKRGLDGKELGQFHIDFDLKGAVGSTIHSTQFIGLGKKCYIDKLEGEDKEGNKIIGHHIRLKGVSESSIHHLVKKEKTTLLQLYDDMYKGKTKEFDLLCGGDKDVFEFKNLTYSMKEHFKREISF